MNFSIKKRKKMEEKNNDVTTRAIDELVEDMKVASFPEKEKDKAVSRLTGLVLKKVFVDVAEKIGEDGRKEYAELLEKNPGYGEWEAFFSKRVKDFDSLVEKAIDEIRDDMAEAS